MFSRSSELKSAITSGIYSEDLDGGNGQNLRSEDGLDKFGTESRVYLHEDDSKYRNDTTSMQQNQIIEDNINRMIIQDILELDNDELSQ